ncbi:hypothetical protein AOQ84DRAFT_218536 [Glonium stellatum]|uniref:Uncharacterized protein n=1 Tax=Glonium stellatum TaxID=574774 RepID=A0A8E2F4P0_9PEZI|nr:hypothetical protein AOQ84DRAFT_218536 [Glonium stellatum]
MEETKFSSTHLRVMTGAVLLFFGGIVGQLMHELMNDHGSGYDGVFCLSLPVGVCMTLVSDTHTLSTNASTQAYFGIGPAECSPLC